MDYSLLNAVGIELSLVLLSILVVAFALGKYFKNPDWGYWGFALVSLPITPLIAFFKVFLKMSKTRSYQ